MTSFETARRVLGQDFITPLEVNKSGSSIIYTRWQVTCSEFSIPSLDVLYWCKENGCVLHPGPVIPVTLKDLLVLEPYLFPERVKKQCGSEGFFARDYVSGSWLITRKGTIFGSTRKTLTEQQPKLGCYEDIPNAAQVAWFLVVYYRTRREWLLKTNLVRTKSVCGDGRNSIVVGGTEPGRVDAHPFPDERATYGIGLTSMRRI